MSHKTRMIVAASALILGAPVGFGILFSAIGEIGKPGGSIGRHIIPMAIVTVVLAGIAIWLNLTTNKQFTERIAQAENKFKEEPKKTKPAWDLARLTLEQYFNRNLSHVTWIFWLSLFVMLAGFVTILWGVQQAVSLASGGEKLDSLKALPPIIAALAGVITEFIGATFLLIYRSTLQQAAVYSKTLERINSVGMAMQILDTMPDEAKPDDIKNQTKAKLVMLLVGTGDGASSPEPFDAKPENH